MFSIFNSAKVIVLVGLLLVIIYKINFKDIALSECYIDKISYLPGDEVTLYYTSLRFLPFCSYIPITDLGNNNLMEVCLPFFVEDVLSNNALETGLNIHNHITFKIPENTAPGIYFINKKHPIIIKSKTPKEITVVYPMMNNLIYQDYKSQTVFNINAKTTNFKRTVYNDQFTEGIGDILHNLPANFIADIDLEDKALLRNQKLIIIYGKSGFYTPQMQSNLHEYIEQGGNVLLICSYFQNNICWYDTTMKSVTLIADGKENIQSWAVYCGLNKVDYPLTPYSYVNGGFSADSAALNISRQKHPIMHSTTEIKLKTELNMSLPVVWRNEEPLIDTSKVKYFSAEIIAYGRANYYESKGAKGIFTIQQTVNSGKIVNLVSQDWCLAKNMSNHEIKVITQNTIQFLTQ